MQRHGPRHFTAYTITAVAYLLVIGFIYYTQSHHFVSSQKPKESVIKMSLSQFVPEVVTPPEPKVEKVVEPIVEPEPVVEKEPEVIKEIIPEPVVEKITPKVVQKVEKKKPVKKEKKKKKKVTHKKSIHKKSIKKKVSKKKTSKRQASKQQSHSSKAERNKFKTSLKLNINKNIIYPRIAKKRHMEGRILVKFTILANGNVGKISLSGPTIFYKSVRNAIKKAFPINVKNVPFRLPEVISLKFTYILTHN
jgi:protein TonB